MKKLMSNIEILHPQPRKTKELQATKNTPQFLQFSRRIRERLAIIGFYEKITVGCRYTMENHNHE